MYVYLIPDYGTPQRESAQLSVNKLAYNLQCIFFAINWQCILMYGTLSYLLTLSNVLPLNLVVNSNAPYYSKLMLHDGNNIHIHVFIRALTDNSSTISEQLAKEK